MQNDAERNALKPIDLIVVPYDDARPGWRMGAGPLSFIEHGLPGVLAEWVPDVNVDHVASTAADPFTSLLELARGIAGRVRASRAAGRLPVVLSGNCSATIGAVAGLGVRDLGVVWFDAHGDLNTPATSPSGFLDGMAAAMLLGWCHTDALATIPGHRPLEPERFLAVGGRAFDPGEEQQAVSRGVRLVSPGAVARQEELEQALDALAARVAELYVHLDLDVLDPAEYGPANGFAVPGGLALVEAIRTVRAMAARRPVAGLTLSAYDPAVDPAGLVRAAAPPLIHAALTRAAATPAG